MWWKQWCHARAEGRGCELSWAELSCEREPGRDSAAASLLLARGETDRLKTARGHNGFASGRSLTHWTFDEHGKQGERVKWRRRDTLAACFFCPLFCLLTEKENRYFGRQSEDAGSDVSETKATCKTVYWCIVIACQLVHSVVFLPCCYICAVLFGHAG